MIQHRFDTLAKALARGHDHHTTLRAVPAAVPRRQVLQQLAGGGVMAAILAAAGLGETPAAAGAPAGIAGKGQGCTVEFEATVRQGPSAGLVLKGALSLPVEPSGSINQGVFVLTNGTRLPLVGQATGRAINLLIQLPDGHRVYGVGTMETDLGLCQGMLGGVFTGPLAGDLGDWLGIKTFLCPA